MRSRNRRGASSASRTNSRNKGSWCRRAACGACGNAMISRRSRNGSKRSRRRVPRMAWCTPRRSSPHWNAAGSITKRTANSRARCPGYCGAQDTFFVGTFKGVGRVYQVYQQTFIDTYSKVTFAKRYEETSALTAADLLNDRVLPFFESHGVPLLRTLTDRGSEFGGDPGRHPDELYLQLEDITPTRTKTKPPQTNGICERVQKTILQEFYQRAFRTTVYHTVEALQADLDQYLEHYNGERPHQGRWCYGKTPMETFLSSVQLAHEKYLARVS